MIGNDTNMGHGLKNTSLASHRTLPAVGGIYKWLSMELKEIVDGSIQFYSEKNWSRITGLPNEQLYVMFYGKEKEPPASKRSFWHRILGRSA